LRSFLEDFISQRLIAPFVIRAGSAILFLAHSTTTIPPGRSAFRNFRERWVRQSLTTRKRCIIYIMRRTQLYLDEDLWTALHSRARSQKTTISELVRASVREHYFGKSDQRAKAMQEFIGIRKDTLETQDTDAYVRTLRRSHRLDRLLKK